MQPTDTIRMVDAQLRYYMRVDPDLLDDHQWAVLFNNLVWIRQQEAKAN